MKRPSDPVNISRRLRKASWQPGSIAVARRTTVIEADLVWFYVPRWPGRDDQLDVRGGMVVARRQSLNQSTGQLINRVQ